MRHETSIEVAEDTPGVIVNDAGIESDEGGIAARIAMWAAAWKRLHSVSVVDDPVEVTARFVGALSVDVAYLRTHLSANERDRAFELQALLAAASAVPAIDPDGSLLRFAIRELGQRRLL
jgi:hypothetical protein